MSALAAAGPVRDPSISREEVKAFQDGLRVDQDRPQRGYNSFVPLRGPRKWPLKDRLAAEFQLFDMKAKQYKRPDMNEDLRTAGTKWKNLTTASPAGQGGSLAGAGAEENMAGLQANHQGPSARIAKELGGAPSICSALGCVSAPAAAIEAVNLVVEGGDRLFLNGLHGYLARGCAAAQGRSALAAFLQHRPVLKMPDVGYALLLARRRCCTSWSAHVLQDSGGEGLVAELRLVGHVEEGGHGVERVLQLEDLHHHGVGA